MPTRLLFVRHGDSKHDIGPSGCRGLTFLGRDQAQSLAVKLSLFGPAVVYSSTLRRAVETATPIAAALGVPVVEDCGLCTWHTPPHADGMRWADYRSGHPAEGGGVFTPFEQGNETWAQLVARTGRAVTTIAQRHRGRTAILVGHDETVEASFHVLAGQPLHRAFDLAVPPASITTWTTDGDPAAWPPPRWTLLLGT